MARRVGQDVHRPIARPVLGPGGMAPLVLDLHAGHGHARLFAPPPERTPGTIGRPRVVGDRLPKLDVAPVDPATAWARVTLRWYDRTERVLEVASGSAVWYHPGMEPLPVRWALTRDPDGESEARGYFSTCPGDDAADVLAEVVRRWPIEVTFEESRAHLGVETQRQWSDLAIGRETPCLFGLYSLVALLGWVPHQDHPIPIRRSAWYRKGQATSSDVWAAGRRQCWGWLDIRTSARDPAYLEIPRSHLDRLLNAVCSSHRLVQSRA